MSVDLTSIVQCRNLYIDYYYKGNKSDTDKCDIKAIEEEYGDYISKWQAIGSGIDDDTNVYVIEDSDWDTNRSEGIDAAREITGSKASSGNKTGNIVKTSTNAALTLGAGAANMKMFSCPGKVDGVKISDSEHQTWITAIPFELASAIMALANNANSKEADALAELAESMVEQQEELLDAQAEMDEVAEAVADGEQEVIDINDANNQAMIHEQTLANGYYNSYMYLQDKQKRGEELTSDEQSLMKTLSTKLNASNAKQTELQATSTELIETKTEEFSDSIEAYDVAAETMAYTQGMTDYGASFDNLTKTLCIVTMVSDGLNALMAGTNTAKAAIAAAKGSLLFGATAWAWAWVAMGTSAVIMSGIDLVRQTKHLEKINKEINVRLDTQDMNENVAGTYDTDITEYDATMENMDELEVLDLKKKTLPTTTVTTKTKSATDDKDEETTKTAKTATLGNITAKTAGVGDAVSNDDGNNKKTKNKNNA